MQEKLVEFVATRLPPLKRRKNPIVAALVGVMFGGIGLAIYLRSWVDAGLAFVWIIALDVVLTSGLSEIGIITIVAVYGKYGYTRVEASNRVLGHRDRVSMGTVPHAAV
jgi:hypothetical protein